MTLRIKEFIRAEALNAGFFAAGVTTAEKLPGLSALNSWLTSGYCAEMDWMRRSPDARCDPRSLLPGARSVVCAAFEYRFGRGVDYHDVVQKKLRRIWDAMKTPEARARFSVDTSPLLEKALAVKAGIGWQGKHSVVVHPERGSYFVLGEIITDLEIEPDGPVSNQCGDCRRCIDACPTGAIVEPYIIDAGRCLSYLTIEHKGPIDGKLTKHIKPGQYGCDLCQRACPYNKGERYDERT